MTTSGTTAFNENRDTIIRGALRKCGAIAAGEIPGAETTNDCALQLNSMVKALMATGIHIWTETEGVLFTQVGQAAYVLGSGSTDHASTTYNLSLLTANAALNATALAVSSITGATTGASIGVTLTTGLVFWTTVASASGTTINLATGITATAANGANIYLPGTALVRPLRVPQARRWDLTGTFFIETLLTPLSRFDYHALPNKTSTGTITQYFYDPQGGANNQGIMYLWPTPSAVMPNNLKFTFYRPIQDFNVAGDTPDLPQEWLNTLVWNLALQLAPEFSVPTEVYGMIKEQAASSLELAMGFDKEPESTYWGVDFAPYGR